MARPTLALSLIAKNEAHNLRALFESFEGCFDEVHLCDTGSTDDTVKIAEELGAKVSHFVWCDDFGKARNAALAPIQTDYIMWLDCDDVLADKAKFIEWRDSMMELAHYWLATYHYASDSKTGQPLCSFMRERVFKNNLGLHWKYFLHEGVMPIGPNGMVKVMYTPAWTVVHKRTDLDVQNDRNRNLRIFENHKEPLDGRMTYYYGKELFEIGKPVEAAQELSKALNRTDLELHDRILALQYAASAYAQCNQWIKCYELAQMGVALDPNRAEFHCLMGDAYIKLGRIQDSVPFYSAAKGCVYRNDAKAPSIIFANAAAYHTVPRLSIAKVWANTNNLEGAEAEVRECNRLFGDPESAAMLEELERIKKRIVTMQRAVPCEDIVISCLDSPYEWDPEIAKKKSMGGSETAAIEMARWLHELSGRPVKLFNKRGMRDTFEGVEYVSNALMQDYFLQFKPWLHIAWRHNMKLTDALTYVWCHDLMTPGAEATQNYAKILALTPFHKRFLMGNQGIPEDKILVTRNGIIPERFKDVGTVEKDPFRFVFGSSPDRGLDRAMRVLDKVREKHPKVTLHVHYGIEHLGKYGLGDLQQRLSVMLNDRKDWVMYHGATQQDELMKSYKASAYCVQPSDWIETSMISAMELVCCGAYPIMRRLGGVQDTLAAAEKAGMATLVDSDCITELEHQRYVDATLAAIEAEAYKKVSVDPEPLSWKSVAEEWLRQLPG